MRWSRGSHWSISESGGSAFCEKFRCTSRGSWDSQRRLVQVRPQSTTSRDRRFTKPQEHGQCFLVQAGAGGAQPSQQRAVLRERQPCVLPVRESGATPAQDLDTLPRALLGRDDPVHERTQRHSRVLHHPQTKCPWHIVNSQRVQSATRFDDDVRHTILRAADDVLPEPGPRTAGECTRSV